MKKPMLLGASLLIATAGWAQKSKIRDAQDYLSDNNYKKAIATTNDVVVFEDTKNNPDGWYWRGVAYLQAALDSNSGVTNAADESYTSFMKVLALKPDYGKDINNYLFSDALLAYNQGVERYGKKDYSTAYSSFMKTANIYKSGGGSRFKDNPKFAGIAASAKTNAAYSAYYAEKYPESIVLLDEIRATPDNTDANVYATLIDIYQKQKKDEQGMAMITEARKKFPANEQFRNMELNYYIASGKQDVLLTKLQDAVASDPNNAELQFNLGNAYEQAAFPKDAKGGALAKPANFMELFGKAEAAYTKALSIEPNNPTYNYNTGVIYYGMASDITKQMSDITGMSAEETKKYDALDAQRKMYFEKTLPYFDKSYSVLDGQYASKKIAHDDKITYQNVMIGLREIYSRQNNKTKTDELKKKLEELK